MNFAEIKDVVFDILQEAEGDFLLPYQIFGKIRIKNSPLAQRIKNEYSRSNGSPIMGAGAGSYSPAVFITNALNNFKRYHREIKNKWFDPSDIKIKEVQPGSKTTISVWAWKK